MGIVIAKTKTAEDRIADALEKIVEDNAREREMNKKIMCISMDLVESMFDQIKGFVCITEDSEKEVDAIIKVFKEAKEKIERL